MSFAYDSTSSICNKGKAIKKENTMDLLEKWNISLNNSMGFINA